MKDFNSPLRKSFVDALTGLQYQSSDVIVHDMKMRKSLSGDFYCLISNVSSVDNNSLHCFSRKALLTLKIVTKTNSSVGSAIADDIAEQILEIIIPTPQTNGLTAPLEFMYLNVFLESDRYQELAIDPTKLVLERILIFSITVNQV